MFKKLDFPNRLTVEITNRCNVSCTFCPRQKVPMELGDMELALFKKIIDEAAGHLPVALVIFFRGEPLLYPELREAIAYAKRQGIGPIQFTSNAYALTQEKAHMLIDTGVDFVSFSLDTIDPAIYSKSRQQGDLQVSTENVIYFAKECERRRKEGAFVPKIQVSTIEIPEYMERQKEFIAFWQQYADIVRVYYEHDDNGHIVNEEVQEQLKIVGDRKPCRKIFTDFLIYWDGRVALCNYDWRGGEITQNVRAHTISEIWHSPEFETVRKMHEENDFTDGIICKDCHHWKIDYMENGFLGKAYKK